MIRRAATLVSALGLLGGPASTSRAQQPPPPAEAIKLSPRQLYDRAQNEISLGRFDAAGETLKRFLASPPSDEDYRAITERDPTAFQKLRFNIPVWSDNPAANAEYKKVVAQIADASEKANAKFYRDPARVARFVRNLAETDEERIYAEQQLRLSGDAVVPALVDALRTANDPFRKAKIAAAVTKLNPEQLPGLLASSLVLDLDTRLEILRAAAARPDARTVLSSSPDTDLRPHLWYYAASRGLEFGALRAFSATTLDDWTGGASGRTTGPAELVKLARPLAADQASYHGQNPVTLWEFDAAKSAPVSRAVPVRQANDYFALRDLQWALERNPGNLEAIELFLTTAVERAVEAARFGNVLQGDPNLLPILASADSRVLNTLLERALGDNKTALALGLTQILAARFDKPAAAGPFVRGLDYPDARVQLASAVGLLKVPGSVPAGKAARVVDILRRAAAAEAAPPGTKEVGRALIADPSDKRGARLARYLSDLGYRPERFGTGRQLAARLRGAADADLIFVDRHVADPVLADLLAALRADVTTASRPVIVVASDDYARPLSLDRLLLRLATLVAVADVNPETPPQPFRYDPIRQLRDEEVEAQRQKIVAQRDAILTRLYQSRLAQLERLVGGAEFPPSQTLRAYLDLRLPQLTLAALDAEYGFSAESAPNVARLLADRSRTLSLNPRLRYAATDLDTTQLARIAVDLDESLDKERRAQFEAQLARTDSAALSIEREGPAEPALNDRLGRLAVALGGVTVVPEPNSVLALQDDIRKAVGDPSQLPVPADVKKDNAKLAVEYLRRMAVGEITGFDVRPAAPALRAALRDDDLADMAIDAVARFGTPEAQQDLIAVALGIARPLPIRIHAAERAIQNVETFGRLVPSPQLQALRSATDLEKDPALRARLGVLATVAAPRPTGVSDLIQKFPLPFPPEPKPEPAPVPAAPKPEPGKN